MPYVYRHFISQNTAPKGTKSIGVYDDSGNKVLTVPLGGLTPTTKAKQYSFGLVSDVHLWKATPEWKADIKFDSALSYFESKGCVFCTHCGDITNEGLYMTPYVQGDTTDGGCFKSYQEVRKKHDIPIYGLCGNHESYNRRIDQTLDLLYEYTAETDGATGTADLSYTIEQGNDLFIFVGQPYNICPMRPSDLQWLYETLEANRNKRCFVFVHSFIPDDSGNALSVQDNSIFGTKYVCADWSQTHTQAFKNLLTHYKNTVLFHGHSHLKFKSQELDKSANYTEKNGFKSVHIPSLGTPRDVVGDTAVEDRAGSEGYIVDVYDDCIVLNGMDFINNECVPLGVYKIDTTSHPIEANTFTDSTGTISTNG